MNLQAMLAARVEAGRPVRAGLIGAGKFGSMFLSQVPHTPGMEVAAIADLAPDRARAACRAVGWDDELIGRTAFLDDGGELCGRRDLEVVIDATGSPAAGIAHALASFEHGKHIVMVNVEADVLAGAALAARARKAGVVYSMAYGDQPALTAEMVDWARSCGLAVVAAGKGTKYLPAYHQVTPDDVWAHYGLTPEEAQVGGMNAQMFNSFLDGTKSAIEMAAIANACGLRVPEDGLSFPPCGVDDLPHVLRPKAEGGVLEAAGMVEVVSSLERDGRPVFRDLRWGVYVVIEAPNAYAAACFRQYGLKTDASGRYAAMYKPFHLIGLELNISVLNAALRGEPTGATRAFRGDAVAVAKRALRTGETLDGEGGYTVWGRLAPAPVSVARGLLPIGLAHGVALARDVPAGAAIAWSDLRSVPQNQAVSLRREAEALAAYGAVGVSTAGAWTGSLRTTGWPWRLHSRVGSLVLWLQPAIRGARRLTERQPKTTLIASDRAKSRPRGIPSPQQARICKGCWQQMRVPVPLRGPAAIPFRLFGIRPSRMNPNTCTICEMMFTRVMKARKITVDMTVLFADLRGYTTLSQSLPPDTVSSLLDAFYDECAAAIWEYDGLLNKTIGDSVMAIFNFPVRQDDHAGQAVLAAREMLRRFDTRREALRREHPALGGSDFGVGIGIDSGDTSFGEFGRSHRDLTAIGTVVNTAARAQSAAEGGQILATQAVYERASRHVAGSRAQEYRLKGFESPISLYAI